MRRSDLIRALATIPPFPSPRADWEQVMTPLECAAELLEEAVGRGDLVDRHLLDLGSGTGVLAIGAGLLGASRVEGIEIDPSAVRVARVAARRLGSRVRFVVAPVDQAETAVDTVVMNPPFGAQRQHADRPFWDVAFRVAGRAIYAFALAESRNFIARRAVAQQIHVELSRPVRWNLPWTFPHHRKRRVALSVDLWVLRREPKR
ncbi:MAG: METTL5 family protein [Thermoplasmata archaeon]